MDLTLDRLKHKGAIKRVLFLHNKMSHYSKNMTVSNSQAPACEELQAYLIVSESIHIYALTDVFIRSVLQCRQGIYFIGNQTHGVPNVMFYQLRYRNTENPYVTLSSLLLKLGCEKFSVVLLFLAS